VSTSPVVLIWHDRAKGAHPQAIDLITRAFEAAGCRVDGYPLVDTAALDALLLEREGGHYVVAGGDGSMHHFASRVVALGLVESVSVSLVPKGTGNDLARNLNVPLKAEAAVRHSLDAPERRIDVAISDDGDVAINSIHIGLGAATARSADRLKPLLGSLAYTVAGVVVGLRPTTWDIEVRVDGEVISPADGASQPTMVGLGLGTYAGGGVAITPGGASDDQLIHALVAAPKGLRGTLGFFVALLRGKHATRTDCVVKAGKEVQIVAKDAPWDHDGEERTNVQRRTYRLVPGGLRFKG